MCGPDKPTGNMIVNIGGSSCEIPIISLCSIVLSCSQRVGGDVFDEFDDAIIEYMKRTYNLMVGDCTAEKIMITIVSAYPQEKEFPIEVKGRDLSKGLPRTETVHSEEIREALKEPLNNFIESVQDWVSGIGRKRF